MTYQYERKYPAQCPFLRACGLDQGEAWQIQVGDQPVEKLSVELSLLLKGKLKEWRGKSSIKSLAPSSLRKTPLPASKKAKKKAIFCSFWPRMTTPPSFFEQPLEILTGGSH